MCNERYREIYALSADLMVPGARFEDILRGGIARGQYPAAAGKEEEFIQMRLAAHRKGKAPIQQELPDGRWIQVVERCTRDGGVVGFRTDITELKEREFALQRLATTDPLTGAMNRRRFLEAGESELRRAERYDAPISVALMDIDFFKRINDTHGHAAGDKVLRRLVEELNATLREHDLICRYGGEEFAVLFPETDEAAAEVAAERLRLAVEGLVVRTETGEVRPTVSIGGTQADPHGDSLESALSRADVALYEAKNGGRNRVCFQRRCSPRIASAE
jgi:diguanylate cyclase (GGDEF)-like protein